MRCVIVFLALLLAGVVFAEEKNEGPTNEKAKKTFQHANQYLRDRMPGAALEGFAKADKQDGGHCLECQRKMVEYGVELQRWNIAEAAASEMVTEAKGTVATALAHFQLGSVLAKEAIIRRKDDLYDRAHDEFGKALATSAKFPDALFSDGIVLAKLKRDEEAKARFEQYAKMRPADDPNRQRAVLYMNQPELVRARMAPPFAITSTDGQRISLDDLKGKVVLIDFWATWCAPCREALPHLKTIVRNFQGQPLVVLSISLDEDEQKWKDFVVNNQMSWPQCRDGGFRGTVSTLFGVKAIPHTFTIDADGVLQDERIGDASIEGKLKKLVARARELQPAEKPAPQASVQSDKKD